MNIPNLTNSTVNSNNATDTKGETPFEINVTEKEQFPNMMESALLTLNEVSEKISELLTPVYKDFIGCQIVPVPQGFGYDCRLYFQTPSADNESIAYAFTNYSANSNGTTSSGSAIMQQIKSIESRATQKIYQLTDEGKKGLSKFFLKNFRKNLGAGKYGEANWNNVFFEQAGPYNNGVYAVLVGLDVDTFIKEIYGTKDKSGHTYQYMMTPVRPLTGNASINSDWLVSIQRIAVDEIQKVYNKSGMVAVNQIPMNRAR